jgi:hypothetical protein
MAEKTLAQVAWEAMDAAWSLPSQESWQAVADAVVQAHEARRWQAIETAPRTRQYILAYSPERKMSFQVCWDQEWGYWQMIGGGKCTMEFTHWFPIPAPPQEVEREG